MGAELGETFRNWEANAAPMRRKGRESKQTIDQMSQSVHILRIRSDRPTSYIAFILSYDVYRYFCLGDRDCLRTFAWPVS